MSAPLLLAHLASTDPVTVPACCKLLSISEACERLGCVMRIITWNINGLPSALKSGALDASAALSPDVVCIQETRTQEMPTIWEGWRHSWNNGARKGFWGCCVLSKIEPLGVSTSLGDAAIDSEGRFVCLEFSSFYLLSVYCPAPTAPGGLRRRAVRQRFDDLLLQRVRELMVDKPVIVCGDMNTTVSDDDFYIESIHQGEYDEGWVEETRDGLLALMDEGLVDAYRHLHPDGPAPHTWWAQRKNRRAAGRGWRLDYFFVDERLASRIRAVDIMGDIAGSDHCPVVLDIAL